MTDLAYLAVQMWIESLSCNTTKKINYLDFVYVLFMQATRNIHQYLMESGIFLNMIGRLEAMHRSNYGILLAIKPQRDRRVATTALCGMESERRTARHAGRRGDRRQVPPESNIVSGRKAAGVLSEEE